MKRVPSIAADAPAKSALRIPFPLPMPPEAPSFLQDGGECLVESSTGLYMAARFHSLADEIIRAEIQRHARTLRASNLHPELGARGTNR